MKEKEKRGRLHVCTGKSYLVFYEVPLECLLNQHDGGGMTSIPVADTLISISRKTQPKIVKQPTTQLFRTTALSASTPFI